MHANRKNKAKGFTLVEILIVVVILGILAAIVVPQFTNAANEARGGNVATQVSTIENQLELWAAQHSGAYPDLASANETFADLVTDGFFKDIPTNPFDSDPATNQLVDNTWDSTAAADGAATNVVYDDSTGWLYDPATGNIAAGAPASAAP